MLHYLILRHLECCKHLSDHQYGFCKTRFHWWWSSSLLDHGDYFAIALDISKAFERVWHAFVSKLPSSGIPPFLCDLIPSVLTERTILFTVDDLVSSFRINCDVPQGSVLSSTLFHLFINDLLWNTLNSIHLYSDDPTLYSSSYLKYCPSPTTFEESRIQQTCCLVFYLETICMWGHTNLVINCI